MKVMNRLTVLFAALLATPVFAAEPTNAELAARIAGLEARMAQLEGRSVGPAAPVSKPTSPKALVKSNWQQCRSNMSRAEVIELLGEPTTTQQSSAVNQYQESELLMYGNGMGDPGGSVMMMGGKVMQCVAMNLPN